MSIEFDRNSYLSNFYSTKVEYDGYEYMNAEACFQAQKCKDKDMKKSFLNLSAYEAWNRGRICEGVMLRPDWESAKLSIMEQIVRNKFTQNLELAHRLINTGDEELIGIIGDQFWGCIDGNGQNILGKILMKIRSELGESDTLKTYISMQKLQDVFVKELALQVYENQLKGSMQPKFQSDERRLAYLIMTQRYKNLCAFLNKQKDKYNLDQTDVEELKKNWFLYDDLRELQFIGTDIYSDAMFIKHKIRFLYRSVGKDNNENSESKEYPFDDIGSTMFEECLDQIKSGGKGKLFSYSKCFGKMLIKYANIQSGDKETTMELRVDPWVNAIYKKSGDIMSVQGFTRETLERGKNVSLPLFVIDMSNVRENSVNNLKTWINNFLGEQSYIKRYNDIFDPIGDAEVVSNFTGDIKNNNDSFVMCSQVSRYTLSLEEFCVVLYRYASGLAEKINIGEKFLHSIHTSIKSIPEIYNEYSGLYLSICENKLSNIDDKKINDLLSFIDWDNEEYYMARVKGEKGKSDEKVASFDIYKEKSAEGKSREWKDIIFEALRERSINYSKSH